MILSFTVLAACGGSSASESKADDSAGGSGDLCAIAKRLEGTDFEKQATSGDAAQIKKELATSKAALADFVKSAPAEIKTDAKTMATAVDSLVKVMAKYDYDFAKLISAAAKDPSVKETMEKTLDGKEVSDAADRVSAYLEKNCGAAA